MGECTQLQLTSVTGTATVECIARAAISPQV